MPRTRQEIDQRIKEINKELDSVASQLIKINIQLKNKTIFLSDAKVLNQALYAYSQKLSQEFGELICELINL